MSNEIDASIIGELLLGELDYWPVGVCVLRTGVKDGEDVIIVRGDNSKPVATVTTEVYTDSQLDGRRVKDLPAIAEQVNRAIGQEHEEL